MSKFFDREVAPTPLPWNEDSIEALTLLGQTRQTTGHTDVLYASSCWKSNFTRLARPDRHHRNMWRTKQTKQWRADKLRRTANRRMNPKQEIRSGSWTSRNASIHNVRDVKGCNKLVHRRRVGPGTMNQSDGNPKPVGPPRWREAVETRADVHA